MTMDNLFNRKDHSSSANAEAVITTKLHLDWTIDFTKRVLVGSCRHTVRIVNVNGIETVDFDISDLIIESVEVDGERSSHCKLSSPFPPYLSSKVAVTIPKLLRTEGSEFEVLFRYRTSKKATAIQWLSAECTEGGQHPYVFTLSQAIHARSLFPCQDSPGVKFPYTATVRAPQWCTVLMSALEDDEIVRHKEPGTGTFYFRQPIPVPAYLVALAAGNLDFRDISRRVRIWAEPSVVETAAEKFSETEDYLQAAEALTCPYQWTRYDVLAMPPSFPYGGMENPCLTFATSTLLAGCESSADAIAHEIAHSWTGNLVTNATWEHFWLNEGWTVWLERRLLAKLKRSEDYFKLSAQVGWNHLKDDITRMGHESRFTRLVWPLSAGEDPDDAFSSVPYEKGFCLLYYLEQLVGVGRFLVFAKAYIQKFKFGCVTTGEFRDFFVDYFMALRPRDDALAPSSSAVGQVASVLSLDEEEEEETEFLTVPSTNPKAIQAAEQTTMQYISDLFDASTSMSLSSSDGGGGMLKTPSSSTCPRRLAKKSGKDGVTGGRGAADAEEEQLSAVRAAVQAVDWGRLFNAPGLPPIEPDFSNSLTMAAQVLAKRWVTVAERLRQAKSSSDLTVIFSKDDVKLWSTLQLIVFLEALVQWVDSSSCPLCEAALVSMDSKYELSTNCNAEIMFRWQTLCLRSDVPWIVPHAVRFVGAQGRIKFVRPLYRALHRSTVGREAALEAFATQQEKYHPALCKLVLGDLKAATAPAPLASGDGSSCNRKRSFGDVFLSGKTAIFVIAVAVVLFLSNAVLMTYLTSQ